MSSLQRLAAMVVALWCAACPPTTAKENPPSTAEVQQVLPSGAKLIHPGWAVELDQGRPAIVAVFRMKPSSTSFEGLVIERPSGAEAPRTATLPAPREIDGMWEIEPTAVFSLSAGARGTALVLLYRALRLGSGEDPVWAGYVYKWVDAAWTIDDSLTSRLFGARTVRDARARLRKAGR